MAGSTVNSNNTVDADPNEAALVYTGAHALAWGSGATGYMRQIYENYLQEVADQNQFSWTQQLLVPGLQAAANILLLEKQKEQFDDNEDKRIGYIDVAIQEWCNCVDGILNDVKDATDDVPKPSIYQAVSPSGEQWQTISDNIETSQVARQYICYMNDTHREQDIIRATVLNPKYSSMNEKTWCSISDLIDGVIPKGLTVETMTRSKAKAIKNGRMGRSARQTARDLGIIDYRLQKAGRAEQREERASQNRDVSPNNKMGDIREMMLQPQQRIAYAIQQAQLIQASDQNAYNACARKAPYLMQKVQIQMQKCMHQMSLLAGKAGLVNGNVIDYASTLNSQIRDITSGIGNLAGNIGSSTFTTPNVSTVPSPPALGGNYGGKETGNVNGGFSNAFLQGAGYTGF